MSIDDLTIETPRLILRPTRWEDFDAWAACMGDSETTRFLGGVQPRSTAWRTMMTMAGAWYLRQPSMFSVIEKATGRWVGRLAPWLAEGWPGPEVGWGIVRTS
jgi:RimJ/RimL family protein N-acetyltransferase